MIYNTQNFENDKTILTAAHLQHIEQGITQLVESVNNLQESDSISVNSFGLITQNSDGLTLYPGKVAGMGISPTDNVDYNTWSFVIENDGQIYVSDEEKIQNRYFSITIVNSGSTTGTRYRYLQGSQDTLPTAETPLQVSKGATALISIPSDHTKWSIYTNTKTFTTSYRFQQALLHDELILQNIVISDNLSELLILKKCSNSQDLFLGQRFTKLVSTDNNVNCWRLTTLSVFKRVGDQFRFYKGPIIVSGEWECAIHEVGASDFVGGNAHGDEQLVQFFAQIDGKQLDFTQNFTSFGKKLDIIRTSKLNRCNTPGDQIMDHVVRYSITPSEITCAQTVEFLQEVELQYSYLCMMPVSRVYTHWGYLDGQLNPHDISAASHGFPQIAGNQGNYTMWNDNFTLHVDFNCTEGYYDGSFHFISGSSQPAYNKIYHNFVGNSKHVAEVGRKVSMKTTISYDYNE